jgi:osmotically-inducible protein OsmY
MTTASLTGTDVRLREAVIRQLDWDPEVDDSAIGVSAKDGVVTLTGFIDTYAGKLGAERVVKRVRGVRAVANDVVVRLKVDRTDPDLAADAARAVDDDVVTLSGTVESWPQRDAAERAAGSAPGIRRVDNQVRVVASEPYELEPPDEIC